MIPGLSYIPNYLSADAQNQLIERLDRSVWSRELGSRRVQHYGWRYDYRAQQVPQDAYLGLLPTELDVLACELRARGHFAAIPDQVIVNEYNPGQGIGAHIDCVPCFGPTVASISLGSTCEMEFMRNRGAKFQLLEPGGLLILTGEARYAWTHQIRPRIHDGDLMRSRRVSVTFRTVLTGTP